jgi:predicted phosphohydrolase
MRIVAVADTHLFTDDIQIPDGDVFVHAGDMCRGGDLEELTDAAAWIMSLPHRHKVIVAGNHDWLFVHDPLLARALFAGAFYLQDDEVVIDGIRFYGSPWQPEFNDWAFNLPRGPEIARVWAKIPRGLDVLITHGPPAGIGDRGGYGPERAGCEDLRVRVAEVAPRVHMFGHIHQDGGAWQLGPTLYANVTAWECTRGATVLDIDAHGVSVVEVPPHGRRDDDDQSW